jgi:hypothetical protein
MLHVAAQARPLQEFFQRDPETNHLRQKKNATTPIGPIGANAIVIILPFAFFLFFSSKSGFGESVVSAALFRGNRKIKNE